MTLNFHSKILTKETYAGKTFGVKVFSIVNYQITTKVK